MTENRASVLKEISDSLKLLDLALPGVLPTINLLNYMSQ